MKTVLRIGGVLLIVGLLVGAGAFLLQRQATSSAEDAPATITVSRGNIEENVSATGNVVAENQATLTFASSGTI